MQIINNSSRVEHLTFNQGVTGSNPVGLTTSLTGSVEKPSQTIEI